jgi:hypothetical protein
MQSPGVDWVVAAVLIAEIGVDTERILERLSFGRPGGCLPGAGGRKSGRARKGHIHLRTILVAMTVDRGQLHLAITMRPAD